MRTACCPKARERPQFPPIAFVGCRRRACEDAVVHAPRWHPEVPQPLRWAVLGTIAFGIVGAAYGLAESVHDYLLGSWFGVTLYVAIFGALAGFIFGLIL